MENLQLVLLSVILVGVVCPPGAWSSCTQSWKKPYFLGEPRIKQTGAGTVQIQWQNLVGNLECVNWFMVKYWLKSDPVNFMFGSLERANADSYEINGLLPTRQYVFQVRRRITQPPFITLLEMTLIFWQVVAITGLEYGSKDSYYYKSKEIQIKMPAADQEDLDLINEDEAGANPLTLIIVVGTIMGLVLIILVGGVIFKYVYAGQKKNPDEKSHDYVQVELENEDVKVGNDIDSNFYYDF